MIMSVLDYPLSDSGSFLTLKITSIDSTDSSQLSLFVSISLITVTAANC